MTLVKRRPDRWEKMSLLGRMATDDIILPSAAGNGGVVQPQPQPSQGMGLRGVQHRPGQQRARAGPYSSQRKTPTPGIYRSQLPNGKFTNLMQIMFTDFCKMDCHFCPNSHWVPRKRYAFKVDELARTFMDLVERQSVEGLFLSSGVAGTGSKTTERMVKVVDLIRNKYKFKGYVHLKVMPGTERHIVEAAHLMGTRLSVNLETTSLDHMNKLSKMKHYERDIMAPMAWIDELKRGPTNGAIGQATQLVVGAADETDLDVLNRISQLYNDWELKRVYYSPFRPIRHTPLEEHPWTPMQRTNRLYQVDWLRRVYRFQDDEIKNAFDLGGFLPLDADPKQSIALSNLDKFPLDINFAPRADLMRTPGLGPISVDRIIKNRRRAQITRWEDLKMMGVVQKWAWPFITFPGHRPEPAKQLRLDDVFHQERLQRDDGGLSEMLNPTADTVKRAQASVLRDDGAEWGRASAKQSANGHQGAASEPTVCGIQTSCTNCALYGTPGHPGSSRGKVRYTPAPNFIKSDLLTRRNMIKQVA